MHNFIHTVDNLWITAFAESDISVNYDFTNIGRKLPNLYQIFYKSWMKSPANVRGVCYGVTMMNIAECRIATTAAVAEYGQIAYLCPNCGDAFSGMPSWGYCDNTIDCCAPIWYDVAADAIVDMSCQCGDICTC